MVEDNILVSVVITSYKREIQLIQEAVNSVLEQTYKNLEVIIIDDNNPNTEYRNELQRYALALNNERIHYYPNDKNSGAQFSRNRGILLSKGKYIAFLDDDDIWDRTKIEKQLQLFKEDNKIGLVFCDGYIFEETLTNTVEPYQKVPWFHKNVSFAMELFNDFVGSTSQALVKKECFAQVGLFDVEMPARQDYEMWLRICKCYKVIGINEKLFFHRIHSGEQISSNSSKSLMGFSLIYKKYNEYYKKAKYSNSKMLLKIAALHKKTGQYRLAFKCLIKAFCVCPKCVNDIFLRRKKNQSFADYYKAFIEILSKTEY